MSALLGVLVLAAPLASGPFALPDRLACHEIRGTEYRSWDERDWYWRHCLGRPSADELLARIRLCESGGDYGADTGNGFYGAYQFLPSTWRAVAPEGWRDAPPSEAPPWAQDEAAGRLLSESGPGQWPVCGL